MAKTQIIVLLSVVLLLGAALAQPVHLIRIPRDLANFGYVNPGLVMSGPFVVNHQPNVLFGYAGDNDDLVLAETQIFRPLFTYRQQKTKKLRLKKVIDQK